MAGWNTNGVPTVGPALVNGVASPASAGPILPEVVSHGLLSMDTQVGGGAQPQTVAAAAAQIAMIAMAMQANSATMTGSGAAFAVPGASLLSGHSVTNVALAVAVGANVVITFSNTLLTANSNLLFDLRSVTNAVPGLVPVSIVYSAGSAVITFQNQGAAAIAGTMMFSWHL